MTMAMRWHSSELITPQSSKGILDLEFAKTPERFRQLQLFWNHETVLQNIYLYVLLVVACTWFLISACKVAKNTKSNLFSDLAISAGAFSVLEIFLMILVWNGRFEPSLLQIVYYTGAIKFLLTGIVVCYLILSLFGLFKRESLH